MSTLAALALLNTSLQTAQAVSQMIKDAQLAGREVSQEELLNLRNAAAAASQDTLKIIEKIEKEQTT